MSVVTCGLPSNSRLAATPEKTFQTIKTKAPRDMRKKEKIGEERRNKITTMTQQQVTKLKNKIK
jgi:hypothetical protein